MIGHAVKTRMSCLGIAALLAWGLFVFVPIVRADDPPQPLTTMEEQTGSPPQESDVQERGVQRAPIQGVQPGVTAPLQLVGPTDNLTKVINSLSLKHKSLTTIITTAPGLQLTQPVEISIAYISPAGPPPGGNRITQPYQRKFGNRFVYNDPEGEGTVRHMRIDVWITEPKPGGGQYSYSLSWQPDLDPVYDITVSPLTFELRSNCDLTGNSEIRFRWAYPDAHDGWNRFSFTTTPGRTVMIQQFAWTKAELTATAIASQRLHLPAILWTEHDPQIGTTYDGRPTWDGKLPALPGKTQVFDFNRFPGQPYPGPDEIRGNTCIARIQYRIVYNLRAYPNL